MAFKQANIALFDKGSTMKPAEKCKIAGFSGLNQVAKLSGESPKSLANWLTRYPRRFELILKGLLFERAIVQAESIEEISPKQEKQ